MKRRARRVVLGAAALVAALVTATLCSNWSTVRDHAQAWWFVLTRETKSVIPTPVSKVFPNESWAAFLERHDPDLSYKKMPDTFLQEIANYSDRPIIYDPTYWTHHWTVTFRDGASIPRLLTANGRHVVEQTYPYPAYVLIGRVPRP